MIDGLSSYHEAIASSMTISWVFENRPFCLEFSVFETYYRSSAKTAIVEAM